MSRRDPALLRWAAIQLVRILGVACVLGGLLILFGQVESFARLPEWLGFLLIAGGMIGVFVVTAALARRWRSPPP